MKLLKNAEVYTPEYIGKKDVLIEGSKIKRISDSIIGYDNCPDCEIYDFSGKKLIPGYIDLHVHITGGGGEQGPASRVPEASLSVLVNSGITTTVGLLGTDGVTRSVENLVTKAKALRDEGLSCYALTGSYAYPSPTILGSVEKDIVLIEEIIGAKLAMSDHRSSNPTTEQLIEMGTATRRAGLISGKGGFVTLHMGAGKEGLDRVFKALKKSDLPVKTFFPTHVARRNEKLLKDSIKFVKMGGMVDFTASIDDEDNAEILEKLAIFLKQDAPIENITLSSDAYGSQPRFDEKGECVGLTYANPASLHKFIKLAVSKKALPLEKAIKLLTTNPAKVLDMTGAKGCIAVGADADMLVLDDNLDITDSFTLGRESIKDKAVVMKGRFE